MSEFLWGVFAGVTVMAAVGWVAFSWTSGQVTYWQKKHDELVKRLDIINKGLAERRRRE